MKPIHFQANWVPVKKRFCVQITGDGHRFIEMMTEARYFEFCNELPKRIVVGGTTVKLTDDDGTSRAQIRKYFETVRQAYLKHKKS